MKRSLLIVAGALASAAANEPGRTFGSAQQDGAAKLVEVLGFDYAFQAPDSIPAGLTTFVFHDRGPSAEHQLVVFRLDDSVSVARFQELMALRPATPPGIVAYGGIQSDRAMRAHAEAPDLPGVAGPFRTTDRFTVVLEPGRYVLACMHPLPEGGSHVAKGMFRSLTVVPGSERERPMLPRVSAVLTMGEYSYTLSDALHAGRLLLRVENAGNQDHEVLAQRLAPGKTLADVRAWIEDGRREPRPLSRIFLGTTRLSPGRAMVLTLELSAGDYRLTCLIPDARDGQPHLAHGMEGVITVR